MRKDQRRALDAFEWAQTAVEQRDIEQFEIAVQTFAAVLLRSGLAVAVSVLQRDARNGGGPARLQAQLATRFPCGGAGQSWPDAVRALATADYMLLTRELVAFLTWLRRACRAVQPRRAQP
jgi:hypothetical protein